MRAAIILLGFVLGLGSLWLSIFTTPTLVSAADRCGTVEMRADSALFGKYGVSQDGVIRRLYTNTPPLSTDIPENQRYIYFKIPVTDRNANYKVVFEDGRGFFGGETARDYLNVGSDGTLQQSDGNIPGLKYEPGSRLFTPGSHSYYVQKYGSNGVLIEQHYCDTSYNIIEDNSGGIQSCKLTFDPTNPDETKPVKVSGKILPKADYWIKIDGDKSDFLQLTVGDDGIISPIDLNLFPGNYSLVVHRMVPPDVIKTNCQAVIKVAVAGGKDGSARQIGRAGPTVSEDGTINDLPKVPGCQPGDDNCTRSAGVGCEWPGGNGIYTAIGCVPTDPVTLVNRILQVAVAISGGLALLLMMFGAFEMVTSQGDPKNLQNGRERFVAALIGLLFILFSVVFLKIIGVDILGLDKITDGIFSFQK